MDDDLSELSDDFEDVFCTFHEINLRSPFRLLDLPPELWIRICEFAVIKPLPVRVGREPSLKDQMAITQQPAITRTCRLIRHEALPMFYSLNLFEMVHCFGVPCPRQWIKAMGLAHRKKMRSMLMMSASDIEFWIRTYGRATIDVDIEYIATEPNPLALFTTWNKFRIWFK